MNMTQEEIMEKVGATITEVLDLEEVTLTAESTARDVDGWDSVSSVQIMVALEQTFGIRFRTGEMAAMENVGDLVRRIAAHLDAGAQ